uniref:BTB domain-containing protein n=1 Tax=Panagrellus redivivus TaxID=6233 RepID=A0A7E4V640_PANRE
MSNHVNSNAVATEHKLTIGPFSKLFSELSKWKLDYVGSEKQNIEGLEGAQWWLTFQRCSTVYASIHLHVSKYVDKASGKIVCCGQTKAFDVSEVDGNRCIVDDMYFSEGYRVECTVRFEGVCDAIKVPTFNDTIENALHYPPDTDIVVGESSLKVHRHFLRTISPVFNACFANDSKEAQTGVLKIDDFKFGSVKNAIDYCHGRDVPNLSVEEAIDVLRFADKYDMKFVITIFEEALFRGLSYENFNPIAQYAWKYEREDLKKHCNKYYKENAMRLIFDENFLALPTAIREEIMRNALPAKVA